MENNSKIVTCTAPVNIAVIKYWGKLDERLIIPLNDSISFTLGQNEMCAKTTIIASKTYTKDRFWLNGKEESLNNPRFMNCINEIKCRAAKRKIDGDNPILLQWHIHICSSNNFPTAAGLASSAAGYAALAFALSQLYGVDGDLSTIARLGSGSACRSMYGGMVQWFRGTNNDGSDSCAKKIQFPEEWRSLRAIICVADDSRKKIGSTEGMRRSLETSDLFRWRVEKTIHYRIKKLLEATHAGDWSAFCDHVMKDSNEMHAICQSSFPPFIYMNDTSRAISNLVHIYNEQKTQSENTNEKVCYTFDAGPNACIFVPDSIVKEFASLLNSCFPIKNSGGQESWIGIPLSLDYSLLDYDEIVESCRMEDNSLKYYIHTRIGDGPRVISDPVEHLLDPTTGLPKSYDNTDANAPPVP